MVNGVLCHIAALEVYTMPESTYANESLVRNMPQVQDR